jgi:hypothetical protein
MSLWARNPKSPTATRRFAILPERNIVLELKATTDAEMTKIYDEWDDLTDKKDMLLGVPTLFDTMGRVWPHPMPGWLIADEILPDVKVDKESDTRIKI